MHDRRLGLAAVVVVVAGWVPVRVLAAPATAQLAFDAYMGFLGALIVVGGWVRASRSPMPEVWRPYAAAGVAWAVSYIIIGFYQHLQGRLAPIPSPADLSYLYFVIAIGIMLARLRPGGHEWRDLLDSAIVAVSLTLLASLTRLGRLFAHGDVPTVAGFVLAGYAIVHIVLVSMALMVAIKAPAPARLPLVVLAGSLICIAASDGALLVLRLEGAAARSLVVEALRLVGVSLLAMVPFTTQRLQRPRGREPGLPTVLLPAALALAGVLLVARDSIVRTAWTPLQVGIGATLLALMVLRMTATGFVDLRLRRERAAAIDSLRELEAQRTVMLRAISHEIQNPLTPGRLHAQMVARKAPQFQSSLDVIQRNIDQVSRLAKDLNVIAKSDTGDFGLSLESADMRQLAERVVLAERPDAERRRVRLTLLADAPAPVRVDPDRIVQVLGNLVRNALKFTPAGGHVGLQVRVTGPQVRVTVTDTGRGLDPEEVPRLFTAFTQVHDRSVQPIGDRGSGLGLYISRRLVEAHGGRIGVHSAGRGRGSTFWFEVPLEPAAVAAESP